MSLEAQLVNAWAINNRINLYVLAVTAPAALRGVSASKGRSAGQVFAHIHNVRFMWLQPAAPALMDGLSKIEKEAANDKDELSAGLEASGQAIGTLLEQGLASGRIKGFTPDAAAFFGYIGAHDAYHRGEVGIILNQSGSPNHSGSPNQSGSPLDEKMSYGEWEWGVR